MVGEPSGNNVGQRLVELGHIDAGALDAANLEAIANRMDIRDALLDGGVRELQLLKWLSQIYGFRFLTTEKLARAEIAEHTRLVVPLGLAEKLAVMPLLFDVRTRRLTVAAAYCERTDIVSQIQAGTSARDVNVIIAMPRAVHAAIRQHYRGKTGEMARLVKQANHKASVTPPAFGPAMHKPSKLEIAAPDLAASLAGLGAGTVAKKAQARRASVLPRSSIPPAGTVPQDQHLETVSVFSSLLDQQRDGLRGHSAGVARLASQVGNKLRLSYDDIYGLRLAGLLHDVGKPKVYHLTPLNVARYEGHRMQAERAASVPVRLFEQANLPRITTEAITSLYERVDGDGFPSSLRGRDVPLGARILAVCETYHDLTTHAKNPYNRILERGEGISVLQGLEGQLFDGMVIEALMRTLSSRDSESSQSTVLLVDSNREDTALLDLRLSSAGHEVWIVRTAEKALKLIPDANAIILDLDLEEPGAGRKVLDAGVAAQKPVVVLSARSDRNSIQAAYDAGCAEYFSKPTAPDIVLTKVSQLLARGPAKGVLGSLADMPLPELIQVFSGSRRTGRLIVRSDGSRGELIFGEGSIYDARFGDARGEQAFYNLLRIEGGEFELDSSFSPTERTIHQATESLLLEGMRRIDESRA